MDKEAYEILKRHGYIKMDMPSKYNFLKRLYLNFEILQWKLILLSVDRSEFDDIDDIYHLNDIYDMNEAILELKLLLLSRKGDFQKSR